MENTKQKIEIVEYHEGLAAAVAQMWNLSRDGWGGDAHVTTEEKVRTQEANSSNLHLYLALDGNEVVGYCGLSEYREDEGALYIPLLNVRTDYHGAGIGKQLVLKAVERSVELGWPRLDLYTWPGNSKAVPLYKKCGFFWEDRDDTTHLMNFMPTVLNTEAVEQFFEQANWYDASTRVIEVKPDSQKENDFTFYEYKWEKGDQHLRMEFERSGRGLRLIETNDYRIAATVEDFKLVANANYKIRYDIENKSDVPLHIQIQGENHQIIQYSFQDSVKVIDRTTIEAHFSVGDLLAEQSSWRTHPSVVSNLLINGKKATFATGILPKLPAKLKAVVPGSQSYLHKKSTFYVDVENSYNEPITLQVKLPTSDWLQIEEHEVTVQLQAKGKTSVPITYELSGYGFYSPTLEAVVTRENGQSFTFKTKIGAAFKGVGVRFSGECDDYWRIYNGLYQLYLDKNDNEILPARERIVPKTIGLVPKIGKPYSTELSKRKPKRVDYREENGAMILEATYESTDFPQLELVSVSKLFAEGLLEQSYIVRNGSDDVVNGTWLYQPVYQDLTKPVFPMNNSIIAVDETASSDFGLWDSHSLTENWFFSRYERYPHGVTWPQHAKVGFESWYMYIEHNIGDLPAHSERQSEPVYISIGAYQNWEEFRSFARSQHTLTPVLPERELTLSAANTPVVSNNHKKVVLVDNKSSYLQGSIAFEFNGQTITEASVSPSEQLRTVATSLPGNRNPIDKMTARYTVNGICNVKSALLLTPNATQPVQIERKEIKGTETVTASNGVLSISAAASFYPALYSLKTNGKEWLHSSYPKTMPKSWFNPWSGGIHSSLRGINNSSLGKEISTVEKGSLTDTDGNEWEGLKLSTTFVENEAFKGLGMEQYFVMLPGISVLACVTKFKQYTGTYLHDKDRYLQAFLHPATDLSQSWVKNRDQKSYVAGQTELNTMLGTHAIIGSFEDNQLLQMISETSINAYMNKEVMAVGPSEVLNVANGEEYVSQPVFFVGHDSVFSQDEVRDFQNISFR
ncbi:GNAT family N-acetyltransferase [Bacillus fonticola]|uniref:GNAT family N-acetyltransferase n=1 Tax=Bacillus fonticola TaxID=2728853 RepID=UPI0014746F43|nr:GNAT family N-acetyltransferase [Bacillus fonticola]